MYLSTGSGIFVYLKYQIYGKRGTVFSDSFYFGSENKEIGGHSVLRKEEVGNSLVYFLLLQIIQTVL